MAENGFIGTGTDSLRDEFVVEVDDEDGEYHPVTVRLGTKTNLFLSFKGAEKLAGALNEALMIHAVNAPIDWSADQEVRDRIENERD